ncbi:NADH-quinone oxidoreductase subunit L [Streptomyces sp. NPDC058653]|uniref:NADH-quinone oxidoreductase subunit 5 family protein n=1 Tax=Streptomyces sp. NPDC058653 TaxID=3346576 RepID=UPI0036563AE7
MSALLWALVTLPLGAGALLTVAVPRRDRWVPAVAVTVAVATLGIAIAAALTRPAVRAPLFAGMDAGLAVDGLSAVMVVTVAAVTTAVLAFAVGEFGADAGSERSADAGRERSADAGRGRFFGLMLVFSGAMLVTVTATTLPLLLMAWELMGATSWALIGHRRRAPGTALAADVAFLTTRTADLGLYVAAGAALAGGVTTLRLDALPGAASPWPHVITAGIVLAALGKSAQLPFSFWLSRAMEGPSPVSALLHSATMVAAGAYLLLRLEPLLTATGWAGPLVAWSGVVTALALGVVAAAQTDLKQLLAASTCAQIGFIVLAAGSHGVAGGTTQLVAHAATKSALFLAAGAWLTALGTKRLPALRGAARAYPPVGAAFTVGALTLAGLPPLSLWAAKDQVLAAARTESVGLYVVGLMAAAVAAVYSLKALWYVTRPLPPGPETGYDTEGRGTRHTARTTPVPLLALTFAAAVLGVLALPGPDSWLRGLLGAEGEPSPEAWEPALSACVALAAAGFVRWWASRPVPLPRTAVRGARNWLFLERTARLTVFRPVLALARALAVFDDRVVDGAVRGIARGGLAAAQLARRLDDGGVDAAVRAVASGARSLGRAARRPQTGLLHQYYAQAAAGFAALVLIILTVR